MRKPDLGGVLTTALFGVVCAVTGWLLFLVGSTLVRDISEGDWSGVPILLVGVLLYGAPFVLGAYVLWGNLVAPHLPRRVIQRVITANPRWMTEQLRALPFVTGATAAIANGVWRITVDAAPLSPAQASALLEASWVESATIPAESLFTVDAAEAFRAVLGRDTRRADGTLRVLRSDYERVFGQHPTV